MSAWMSASQSSLVLSTISGRLRLEMSVEMRYSLAHCSRELQCLTCSPWITTCCCRGSHHTTPSSPHGLSWKRDAGVGMVLYKGWRQLWLKSSSLQTFNNFTFILTKLFVINARIFGQMDESCWNFERVARNTINTLVNGDVVNKATRVSLAPRQTTRIVMPPHPFRAAFLL
jgi:hypothetical protein